MAEVDVHNTPPVPPQEEGGNLTIGWRATGLLCLLLGWGGAVLLNLLLHRIAPAGGSRYLGVWIGPGFGPYAQALLGIGAAIGLFGIVLLYLARRSPGGPFILPGYPY